MTKKFFIIAGEASGDLLGVSLIKELKKRFNNEKLEFIGVGGDLMKKEGFKTFFNMNELSVMGFSEVLPHIFKLLKRIKEVASHIKKEKPDYIITIDSPDFNFRVMKKLQNYNQSKKIHLIAPSVWAYRENRAQKISKLYDLLLTILPFEPPYFEKYGLKTKFIGHPIMSDEPDFAQQSEIRKNFRLNNGFSQQEKIIYITPGSRISEVKKIFTEFVLAINIVNKKIDNLSVIIATVSKTKNLVKQIAKNLDVKYILINSDQKNHAMLSADFALAKSGTNTLEISLYRLPMIICYKVSLISYLIIKSMIKINFGNLVNLIKNKMIIQELLQYDCNSQKISENLLKLINNKEYCQNQIEESQDALKQMGLGFKKAPTQMAVDEILKL